MAEEIPESHLAVVQTAPFTVEVVHRKTPELENEEDVIVKISVTALCGSDIHIYRGAQPPPYGFIMGHEFTGRIVNVGSNVKNFHVGDRVVSPFTVSCGTCHFCERGWTGRCVESRLYGSTKLEGAQAEYVRVPLADSTLYQAPEGLSSLNLILMADIFPTGFFAAKSAWDILNEAERKDASAVVIGCGPVGLCAITAATKRFKTVYAIDSIPDRLELAAKHGATPVNLNSNPQATIAGLPGGGADAILELVGAPDAVLLGIELARPGGVVISCGVHNQDITMPGRTLYGKNLRFQFGRCPVRSVFDESLALLREVSRTGLFEDFIEAKVPLSEAPKYYELFNDRKIGKVAFIINED